MGGNDWLTSVALRILAVFEQHDWVTLIACSIVSIALILCGVIYVIDRRNRRFREIQVSPETQKVNQRAKQILDKGGPDNLEEFRFLFPECCSRCGGRQFLRVRQECWTVGDASDTHLWEIKNFDVCVRCSPDYEPPPLHFGSGCWKCRHDSPFEHAFPILKNMVWNEEKLKLVN